MMNVISVDILTLTLSRSIREVDIIFHLFTFCLVDGGASQNEMRQVSISVASQETCRNVYGRHADETICLEEAGKNSCRVRQLHRIKYTPCTS